ncbi:protein FAM166B-like isoform X2 [Scyliorhinus canicula]|uniref:protein FAM166B-like isoform X2 n=1 Tax=Scyliorhinus canicula TaxID=7830 RepID=UPI0018F548EB|nr:protein FAM166B-like isoform X2 [Scyliorhinus canicula]
MPFPLPLKAENVFSTFDPNFMPGYGGYIPKLRSHFGETYGNATLGLLSYEPGQPKSPRLTLTQTKPLYNPQVPRHLLNRTYGHPEITTYAGQVQNTNIKNGYFYPRDGKYHFALKHSVYDNNPEATSAIQTIKELKQREMMECKRSDLIAPNMSSRPPSVIPTGEIRPPDSCTFIPMVCEPPVDPCYPGRMYTFQTPDENPVEQNSRIIYRPDSPLHSTYNGFVPGHQFSIGKNWGRSTYNALGIGEDKPQSLCPT